MASINLIKASDGTGNASTATVQTVRNSGVTTIIVDTVNNIPATFMGSMGTPHTFVDPVTSEEITVISEATAVDFTGHVSGANLEIDSIAPGYTDLGSAVGDIIVIRPTTAWADNIATVLAVAHSDTGAITNASVTTAKQKVSSGTSSGLLGTLATMSGAFQSCGTIVLPTVSQAHKYQISVNFMVQGATENDEVHVRYSVGGTATYAMYSSVKGYWHNVFLLELFTSSATGGQTITFEALNASANRGSIHNWLSHYTIVDLGCA